MFKMIKKEKQIEQKRKKEKLCRREQRNYIED